MAAMMRRRSWLLLLHQSQCCLNPRTAESLFQDERKHSVKKSSVESGRDCMILPAPVRLKWPILANRPHLTGCDFQQVSASNGVVVNLQAKKKLAAFGRPWSCFERDDFPFRATSCVKITDKLF
jgi:hypothetical protein